VNPKKVGVADSNVNIINKNTQKRLHDPTVEKAFRFSSLRDGAFSRNEMMTHGKTSFGGRWLPCALFPSTYIAGWHWQWTGTRLVLRCIRCLRASFSSVGFCQVDAL